MPEKDDPFADVREPGKLTEDEDGAPLPPEDQAKGDTPIGQDELDDLLTGADREIQKITKDEVGSVEDVLEDIEEAPRKNVTKPSQGFDDRI